MRRRIFMGMVTLLTCQTVLRADAPTTLEALLALPPSPGAEVLLLPHAADGRVQQRWRQALTDPDADRRAAAARMLGIAGVRTAIGTVTSALRNEQDPVARAEMLQVLVVIGSEVTDRAALSQLADLPASAARRISRTIATLRPASVATFLMSGGTLAEARDQASSRTADLLSWLLRVAPAEAGRLEAEPERLAAGTLQGALHLAHTTARPVGAPLLMAGLRADVDTAGEVLSYLPPVYGRPQEVEGALRTAYARWRASQQTTGDATHDFVLALADRWLGRSPAAPLGIDAVDEATLTRLQLPVATYAVMSREERRALVQHLGGNDEDGAALAGAGFGRRRRESAWDSHHGRPGAVLLADLPGATLADLVRLTACDGKPFESERALTISYRPDGRPLSIMVAGTPIDAACDQLSQLVARASYGDPTLPGDKPGRALQQLHPEFVSCQRDRDAEARAPVVTSTSGQTPRPARKTRDQKPAYPMDVQRRRVQGSVVMEALLTRTGCIAEARVVTSIPDLDLPSLQAVAAWRDLPATIDDVPVPLTVTLTVSYGLR